MKACFYAILQNPLHLVLCGFYSKIGNMNFTILKVGKYLSDTDLLLYSKISA